jgi:hypothetical protein
MEKEKQRKKTEIPSRWHATVFRGSHKTNPHPWRWNQAKEKSKIP